MVSRLDWTDEVLAPVVVGGVSDYEPRYNIYDKDDNLVLKNAKISLRNQIVTEGTSHSGTNMNKLMQKVEHVGSFYYDGNLDAPEAEFPTPVPGEGWGSQLKTPNTTGFSPCMIRHNGKIYATWGIAPTNDRYQTKVLVYDPVTETWTYKESGYVVLFPGTLQSGYIQCFTIAGDKLHIVYCLSSTDNSAPCKYSFYSLDLGNFSWSVTAGKQWENNITGGPAAVSPDGKTVYVFGGYLFRSGNVEHIGKVGTLAHGDGSVTPKYDLPLVNGKSGYWINDAVYYNGNYVITGCDHTSEAYRTPDPSGTWTRISGMAWSSPAMKPLGVVNGNLYFSSGHDNILGEMTPDFKTRVYYLNGFAPHIEQYSLGDKKLYFSPSVNGNMGSGMYAFNTETKTVTQIQSPTVTLGRGQFSFCASGDEEIIALNGSHYLKCRMFSMARGILLGTVAKGLSVSASKDLYLSNENRGMQIFSGGWREADQDYLIFGKKGVSAFGQIGNI